MKIVFMNGGLGNQAFQYIFARYIEHITNEVCWIDNSHHCVGSMHNGYELDRIFGIKLNLLSNYFKADEWSIIENQVRRGSGSTAQYLLDEKMNLTIAAETNDYKFNGKIINITDFSVIPHLANSINDIYFHGYWINAYWLREVRELVINELKFPTLEKQYNIDLLNRIKNTESVAVHVRRGDFIDENIDLPISYYNSSMKTISERQNMPMYYVFSDNIQWCKDHYAELGFNYSNGNIVFVEGNNKEKSYIDLQLMSNCKNMIISNSAFSYLGALINQNKDKKVINPYSWRSMC